jgi:hypothetical protein
MQVTKCDICGKDIAPVELLSDDEGNHYNYEFASIADIDIKIENYGDD